MIHYDREDWVRVRGPLVAVAVPGRASSATAPAFGWVVQPRRAPPRQAAAQGRGLPHPAACGSSAAPPSPPTSWWAPCSTRRAGCAASTRARARRRRHVAEGRRRHRAPSLARERPRRRPHLLRPRRARPAGRAGRLDAALPVRDLRAAPGHPSPASSSDCSRRASSTCAATGRWCARCSRSRASRSSTCSSTRP